MEPTFLTMDEIVAVHRLPRGGKVDDLVLIGLGVVQIFVGARSAIRASGGADSIPSMSATWHIGRQTEADALTKLVSSMLARLSALIEEQMASGNYSAAGESCQFGIAVARKAGDQSMLARLKQLSVASEMAKFTSSIDSEFAAERYSSAKTKCREARSIAQCGGANSAVAKFEARLAEIDYAIQLHGQVAQAIDTLDTTPHDPTATSVLVRYVCFVREDWANGLSLLLDSSIPELEVVAARRPASAA